jgi:diguanylate cyclase (GGDEF)-like protein
MLKHNQPHILLAILLWLVCRPLHAADAVTLQLKWVHQFQFAGYYMALEKGFYRDAGLDVTLRPNGYNGHYVSPVEAVLSGDATYGISNSGLVRDYAQGKPIVALAATLQHSAVSWLVLDRPDIRNLHDLVGKRLMTVFPLGESVELLAPFLGEGITLDQLNLVQTGFDLQPLIDGKVDAYDAYVTNEPYQLEQKGIAYQLIDPRTYGIDFYGDVLFTSRKELLLHPDRVQAFRRASLKGWNYAMNHIPETITLIRSRYAPEKTVAQLQFEANAMLRLMQSDLIDIGHMNRWRWQRIAEFQLDQNTASALKLDDFLYSADRLQEVVADYLYIIGGISLLAMVLLMVTAWYVRLNRRLKDEINARQEAETQLRRMSETDPLTGLHNLRYLDEQLTAELARYHRHGDEFCVVMLDIDYFKSVNDNWGHPAGDRVLKQFAQRLREKTRHTDTLARIGGEEFLILLRNTPLDKAGLVAEGLRKSIESTVFELDNQQSQPLTASIGVCSVTPTIIDVCELFSRADQAMYQAKSQGRNRVLLFSEPDERPATPDISIPSNEEQLSLD